MTLIQIEIHYLNDIATYGEEEAFKRYCAAIKECSEAEMNTGMSKYEKCVYGRYRRPKDARS